MPLFERGSHKMHFGEGANGSDQADQENGETGDAYWFWTPIEVDPIPLEQGLSDMVPLDKQLQAVDIALNSFGRPYSEQRRSEMRAAWHEVMDTPLPDQANG